MVDSNCSESKTSIVDEVQAFLNGQKVQMETGENIEYTRSLKQLESFLKIDVKDIRSIGDLSAKASLVGHSLTEVVKVNGEIQKLNVFRPHEEKRGKIEEILRYEMDREEDGFQVLATVLGDEVKVAIKEVRNSDKLPISSVVLPVRGDILGDNENRVKARDWRNNLSQNYNPVESPNDSEVQQGFCRVMQECVGAVLSILPSTAKAP